MMEAGFYNFYARKNSDFSHCTIDNGYVDLYSLVDSKKIRQNYTTFIAKSMPILEYVLRTEKDFDYILELLFYACTDEAVSLICDWIDKHNKTVDLILNRTVYFDENVETYLYKRYKNLYTIENVEKIATKCCESSDFNAAFFFLKIREELIIEDSH